jgi:hypothetical protein
MRTSTGRPRPTQVVPGQRICCTRRNVTTPSAALVPPLLSVPALFIQICSGVAAAAAAGTATAAAENAATANGSARIRERVEPIMRMWTRYG